MFALSHPVMLCWCTERRMGFRFPPVCISVSWELVSQPQLFQSAVNKKWGLMRPCYRGVGVLDRNIALWCCCCCFVVLGLRHWHNETDLVRFIVICSQHEFPPLISTAYCISLHLCVCSCMGQCLFSQISAIWFTFIPKTMQAVNKKMDPQNTLKTMLDFQKENLKMGMTEDMSKAPSCPCSKSVSWVSEQSLWIQADV